MHNQFPGDSLSAQDGIDESFGCHKAIILIEVKQISASGFFIVTYVNCFTGFDFICLIIRLPFAKIVVKYQQAVLGQFVTVIKSSAFFSSSSCSLTNQFRNSIVQYL